jgi:hypothetical protein
VTSHTALLYHAPLQLLLLLNLLLILTTAKQAKTVARLAIVLLLMTAVVVVVGVAVAGAEHSALSSSLSSTYSGQSVHRFTSLCTTRRLYTMVQSSALRLQQQQQQS